MSLRTHLILSYSLIIVLCLSIVTAAVFVTLQSYRDRFAVERLDDMTVPIYVQVRSLAQGRASLGEVWTNLKEQTQKTGVHILMVDDEGNILRQTSSLKSLKEERFDLPSEGLSSDMSDPYRGIHTTSEGQSFIFVAYPLRELFSSEALSFPEALVLAVPRTSALASWDSMVRPLLWAGLIALVVSVVIAIFLARSIYRPIHRVTVAAEEIAQGRYDQKIPIAGSKETKELALSFNQMASQVKLAQQRLRDFVADVSHELKSPLTSIRGFAQAILDGTASDDATKLKATQIIDDESKRIIRQVDELLELSRMQSGQIQMVREAVDIKELLEHCQEIFSMRAKEKGLSFRTEVEPLVTVIGDIDCLEQVFSNLLDNTLKHTPRMGEITITGRQITDSVEIKVADNGPGIGVEELPHVFERFYQAGGARTGTGLGLAIAREIVLAHGGDIDVSSTLGKGTEFTVRLPTGTTTPVEQQS